MGDHSNKRPRDDDNGDGDLKRVAEAVMVLSALAQLRGGSDPTPAEIALVAEARDRLAAVCEIVRPKELFSSEAVRALVQDLGLNGSSDPMAALRPPKLSIKDKLLLAKRKMEEIKEIPAHPSIYSNQNFLNSDSPGTLYGNARFQQDKSNPLSFHGASPVPQIPVSSVSLKQSQGSVVLHQTGQSPAVLQSHGPAASFTFDGRTPIKAGNEHLPQKSITASYMHSPYALASSSLAKFGETNMANQLHDHTPSKADMTFQSSQQVPRNHATKVVAVQMGTENILSGHQPAQGLILSNASTAFPDHNNIVQKIQNFLQGSVAVNSSWDPPSSKYIDEPLDCQICKIKITDVDSVLVCDACEKGNHLKCLQLYGNKNVPKQDWHCARCLTSNHGKPLPPKYGRVTRAPAAQNVKPKKTDKLKPQNTQQGVGAVSNGKPGVVQETKYNKNGGTSCDLADNPRINGTGDVSGTDLSATGKEQPTYTASEHLHSDKKDNAMDTTPETQICPSEDINNEGFSGSSPADMKVSSLPSQLQSSVEQKSSLASETDDQHHSPPDFQQNSQKISQNSIDASANYLHENDKSCGEVKELQCGTGISQDLGADGVRLGGQADFLATPNGELDVQNGTTGCSRSSESDVPRVEWVGDVIEVVEDRSYYPSCSINGVLHKVQDHVLVSTVPSKLQALWEENKSGSRFATVCTYYFPNDIPKTVERPCTAENNEVYASKHCRDIMARSIQGTCKVLPSDNSFREKNKEMIELGTTNCSSYPIFLCKWIYDDSTCNFEPFTS